MNNSSILQLLNISKCEAEVIVSVIIATYRRDTSLKRAIESLLHQTYKNIEIIVVDDNAEESWNRKVVEIINEISIHHPIIYINNKVNRGSAEARNIGIRRAKGDYITFLDDDDVYLPQKIQNQLEYMIENKLDYCITDLDLYDENDILIERRTRKFIKKYTKNDLLRYHLMYHLTGTDSLMFRLDYILRIGCFPPINIGDEFYLMHRAIEAGGKFGYLPVCNVKAYIHTETGGLSCGESKINGENKLYEFKKKYFNMLSFWDKQYIKMRHYAVLAFAELRRNNIFAFIRYSIYSFLNNPYHAVMLFLLRKKG